MKKLLVFVLAGLLFCTLAFSGAQKEEAAKEAPEIWVWGVPAWGGNYTAEQLSKGNEWAKEKFGVTFKVNCVTEGSTPIQALNLLMAQGEFPDVIQLGWEGENAVTTKNMVAKLVEEGRLAALGKYLDDPKYPTLNTVDKDYMKAYMYKGKLYAWPGYGAPLIKGCAPWPSFHWIMRFDIAVANRNNLPTTSDELYALLKKIKGNYQDVHGNPIVPLGMRPLESMGIITSMIKGFKGAGWQMDKAKRYVPFWASEETYESLKYMNKLWSEGMIDAGFWTLNTAKYQEHLKDHRYGVNGGGSWNVSVDRAYLMNLAKNKGLDDPETKAYRAAQYVMVLHPVKEADGSMSPIHSTIGSYTVVSSKCPDIDAVMKLFDFMNSDEGCITLVGDSGFLGVDWEFVAKPQYWRMIGTADSQTPKDEQKSGAWLAASKIEADKLPRVVPMLMYLTCPSYSAYTTRVKYQMYQVEYPSYGWASGKPEEYGFTSLEWDENWCKKYLDYVTPIPSYQMVIPDLAPLEQSALITIDQRWKEGLAKVVSSDNFEKDYKDFLNSMIKVTDMKSLFEKMHKQWEAWMKDNGDDRNKLGVITVRPEFKAVMGW